MSSPPVRAAAPDWDHGAAIDSSGQLESRVKLGSSTAGNIALIQDDCIPARLCIEIVFQDGAEAIAEETEKSKGRVPMWTEHKSNPAPVVRWDAKKGGGDV